jgi:hypothetical protein
MASGTSLTRGGLKFKTWELQQVNSLNTFVNRTAPKMRCEQLEFLASQFDSASQRFRDACATWEFCRDLGEGLAVAEWAR